MVSNRKKITEPWLEAGKVTANQVKAIIAFANSMEGPGRLEELNFILDWCITQKREEDALMVAELMGYTLKYDLKKLSRE